MKKPTVESFSTAARGTGTMVWHLFWQKVQKWQGLLHPLEGRQGTRVHTERQGGVHYQSAKQETHDTPLS